MTIKELRSFAVGDAPYPTVKVNVRTDPNFVPLVRQLRKVEFRHQRAALYLSDLHYGVSLAGAGR